MSEYHEMWEALPDETKDLHRALASLKEEVEAVDWYNQRIAVTDDDELREVLEHNRDEEIEHAAMVLEWLRRRMDGWDGELSTYLFTSDPVARIEGGEPEGAGGPRSNLGIGSLTEGS